MPELIIVFDSSHYAIKAERVLKDAGIPFDIIPTPRDISADCGISMRMHVGQRQKAQDALKDAGIQNRVFERAGRDGN